MQRHLILSLLLSWTGMAFAQDARVTLAPAPSPPSDVLLEIYDDPARVKPPVVQVLQTGEVLVRTGVTLTEASQMFWREAGKTFAALAPAPVPCPPAPVVEPEKHRCTLPVDYALYLLPDARLCKLRTPEDIGKP